MEFMCVRVQYICLRFFGLLCFLLLHTGAGELFCFFLRTGIIYNGSVRRAFPGRIVNRHSRLHIICKNAE